jgi:hypothetical protein
MIYAPDGTVLEARKEEHWPPEFMQMLAAFALACDHSRLGIRCEQCKTVLQGQNASQDNMWTMECACRKYIGRNPMSSAQKRAH